MTIDSSALLAILMAEPEMHQFNRAIAADSRLLISAASVFESYMILETRRGDAGVANLDLFLIRAEMEVVPFDGEQWNVARRAFRRYGKGRHPAALNFGDCISYALSQTSGEPLLFKGKGFAATDVRPALV